MSGIDYLIFPYENRGASGHGFSPNITLLPCGIVVTLLFYVRKARYHLPVRLASDVRISYEAHSVMSYKVLSHTPNLLCLS